MGSLGWAEILMILVVALIIFGPRKLPELGKSLGQSLAQFRRASEDFKRTWEDEVEMEKRRIEESMGEPPNPDENWRMVYDESRVVRTDDDTETAADSENEATETASATEETLPIQDPITPEEARLTEDSKQA
jgi:TatA/E family protein of Tat protein translocase